MNNMNYTKVFYDEDIDVENQITINNKNEFFVNLTRTCL